MGILMAASRPKDENGDFYGEIICLECKSNPVFDLSFWKLPWFIELSHKMRLAEQQEENFGNAVARANDSTVPAILRQMNEHITELKETNAREREASAREREATARDMRDLNDSIAVMLTQPRGVQDNLTVTNVAATTETPPAPQDILPYARAQQTVQSQEK
ncbi:MAG: hypothetical protein ACREOZ_04685 [Gloeomargaritales cyanobacterium]